MPHPFDRYSAFTDVNKLKEWTAKPLRKSMRVNLLKSSPAEFTAWAKQKKWMTEPVPWCPEGFFVDRVDREEALGKDLLHILGHTYMQEAASMLPVELLNPQPGENVLDMSAAPGSKTTQIASKLGGQGVIIANDVQEKRLWALLTNLQRCSVMNVMVMRKVGQWYGKNMTGRFDRVLCDAPCTAEGTARKDSDALDYCSAENTQKMARLQKDLLEAAIHAAKIGGRIVYSTCTLTPEENEEVIAAMLEKFGDKIEIVDPRDALKEWNMDKAIEDSHIIQKSLNIQTLFPSLRLWPQTYDTEGFFSTLIRKKAATREAVRLELVDPIESEILPGSKQKAYRHVVEKWYGAPLVHTDELLMEGRDKLWITTQAIADFRMPSRCYMGGMPFGKLVNEDVIRVAQEIVTLRGKAATSQVVDLNEDELRALLKGQNVSPDTGNAQSGDVILRLNGIPLCRGLLKDGIVINRLPREIVQMYT